MHRVYHTVLTMHSLQFKMILLFFFSFALMHLVIALFQRFSFRCSQCSFVLQVVNSPLIKRMQLTAWIHFRLTHDYPIVRSNFFSVVPLLLQLSVDVLYHFVNFLFIQTKPNRNPHTGMHNRGWKVAIWISVRVFGLYLCFVADWLLLILLLPLAMAWQ